MKVNKTLVLPEGAVRFEGELSEPEADMVVEIGLNYLIRAGAFPAVTQALEEAQKKEEAAMGYEFPDNMEKND